MKATEFLEKEIISITQLDNSSIILADKKIIVSSEAGFIPGNNAGFIVPVIVKSSTGIITADATGTYPVFSTYNGALR